jgi:hypothetical protein
MEGPVVSRLEDGTFRIRAELRNVGFLPTSLTGRGAVGQENGDGTLTAPIVQPPVMTLALKGAEVVKGEPRVKLDHLRGTGPFLPGVGVAGETVEWIVRAPGGKGYMQVTARSDKAGVVRSEWVELPPPPSPGSGLLPRSHERSREGT